MAGNIFYDKRLKKYGGQVQLQDGREPLKECDTEGQIQLEYLTAMYVLNGMLPKNVTVPETEGIESPNPLANVSDADLKNEIERRASERIEERRWA